MSDQIRRPYDFEVEPEVRDWLERLSDSDFRRVDEVCGLLTGKGSKLGGPWSDHLDGPVWELRIRLRDVAAPPRLGTRRPARHDLHDVTLAPLSSRSPPTWPSAWR